MSVPMVKIKDIAPSKPLKLILGKDEIWQLTLENIEPDTGRLLQKILKPSNEAGSSTHGFDNRYVLYSKLRPYLNKVLLPDEAGLCTSELVPLLPDVKKLDRIYFAHYLKSKTFVDWISTQTAGAKMPRVSMDKFWDHQIPLPPLAEQKRIATILDKVDAIRRKRQQAIKLADEFLRSVFLEMFGDPVTNPKGWETVSINNVCSDIVDCVNRTAETVDYETPYKMIRTTNVRNYKINSKDVRYVGKDVYDKWVRRLKPQIGDIVFTREAPSGEAGIIDTDELFFLGQRTMHFRPDPQKTSSVFLLFELMGNDVQNQIRRLSTGSTVTHLSVPDCKKFMVRMPPLKSQIKFAEIYNKIEKEKVSAELCLNNLYSLFNSLSHKAFSGSL